MNRVGGKAGWVWIFILEGLVTVICAIVSFWVIDDFPDTAKFLTEEERKSNIGYRPTTTHNAPCVDRCMGHPSATSGFEVQRRWRVVQMAVFVAMPD